jgi:hypothetical protein
MITISHLLWNPFLLLELPTQPNPTQCIISWPATLGCCLGDTRQKALLAVVCGAAHKWVGQTAHFLWFWDFCMNEIIFMFVEIQQDGSNKFKE